MTSLPPSDPNPYAPPSAAGSLPSLTAGVSAFRDGKFLMVSDGALLPECCLVTNRSTGQEDWRKQVKISWYPTWILITIIVHLLLALVLMLIFQKKAKVTYSLSKETRGKIVKKRLLGFGLMVPSVVLMSAGIAYSDRIEGAGAAILGGILALIFGLIALVVANPVKVTGHRNGWFKIKGCSPEFLETLPVFRGPF
ncbi:hypothetical protein [Luteolibacter marinus]|uniref:hypothetical protein n=1 Tax=Luteolibacter marinus TaxID=2776705 RepID=UPI0018663897|nr:hypothetical protein [Luteolibacter marinus]